MVIQQYYLITINYRFHRVLYSTRYKNSIENSSPIKSTDAAPLWRYRLQWQHFAILCLPPLIGGALSDAFVWRLSVAYIRPKSRTRKTKIGTQAAHITRDSDTTFKVKRSKVKVIKPLCSPPCWRVRRLQRWAWERVGRGKLLLRCRLLGGGRRFGAHGGVEVRGHTVAAARLQLV